MRCACRRGHTSIRSISVSRDSLTPGPGPGLTPYPPLPSGEGELPTSPLSGTERGSGGEDPGPPVTPGLRPGLLGAPVHRTRHRLTTSEDVATSRIGAAKSPRRPEVSTTRR